MKRALGPEDLHLWTVVTATVRPIPGRIAAPKPVAIAPVAAPQPVLKPASLKASFTRTPPSPPIDPRWIEPGRRRRIARGRDEIGARLDLHGLDQDRARRIVLGFLKRAQSEGARTVLVITGKGVTGQGVLRRRVPEWLADPSLATVIAGFSAAEPHHGGEGALYVALKRLGR